MKHSTFIREWIEYTKFEIGISLNPFNFFQGKTQCESNVKAKNAYLSRLSIEILHVASV